MKTDLITIPVAGRKPNFESGETSGVSRLADDSFFLAGPENHLLQWAVRWATGERQSQAAELNSDHERGEASSPVTGASVVSHNPIVFYGPSGCGKTHLAEGIYQIRRRQNRKKKAVLITGDDFARSFSTAIASKTTDEFRSGICDAELLVVDRIDLLKNKDAAQIEFLVSLDYILSKGHTVVLTMSQFPTLQCFSDERLVARLISGLLVPVSLPGLSARTALLERFAAQLNLRLTAGAQQALAKGLPVSAPQLFGTLSQLAVETGKTTIDVEMARQVIRDREKSTAPTMDAIARLTAKRMGIKLTDLKGKTRTSTTTKVRGIAIYLMRQLTAASLKEIGRYFGGRDHTTIAHSVAETESRIAVDPEFRGHVLKIHEILQK
ncbi:MAG: DnaA/Hda family protein [Planctomycetaceae bacterium]|nr:DnaA/Hda family protein [Planctomycetaceae bacterium]